MAEIRVIQGEMPAMLAAIVRDVALAAPGRIVAAAVQPAKLIATVAALHPDVVIGTEADIIGDEARLESLLCGGGRPARVIALSADGRAARLHHMAPHVRVIEDLSPEALLAAMRGTGPSDG